ncbi:glycosyltransferase family 2 protein [uncultured Bacteroides sp.]|uniref:glycosyltransferase family 2 protein n=1 Tax=uncultured Bacteroides sp. TaxID=162156 RepID=UPI0025F5C1D7|nr:glycosyltransferase family 2 protein [uncultured Bacteroides sp.]
MPKVSVLIPVYNVEKYIERCARSLFEQTLDDIEYVFVNDCTPDESMEILKNVIGRYPTRRSAVKLISHERNRGLATARNTGLAGATGEYVICCDSDDWVEPGMYESMYRAAKTADADLVVCGFYDEYARHAIPRQQAFPDDNIERVRQMLSGKLHCGTWNKLVRRDLYARNGIRFPDGINMWEDVLAMIPVCYHAVDIACLPQPFYHYVRDNGASYTNGMKEASLQNLMEAVEGIGGFLRDNALCCLEDAFCCLKLTAKLNLLLNSSGERQRERNRLYPETGPFILSYSAVSLYWRIALKLASWNFLYGFNAMSRAGKKLCSIKK